MTLPYSIQTHMTGIKLSKLRSVVDFFQQTCTTELTTGLPWTKKKNCTDTRTEPIKCTCCLAATWRVVVCCGQPTCFKRLPHLSKGVVRPRDQPLPSSCLPALLGWVWVGRHKARKGEEEVVTAASELFTIVHNQSGLFGLEWKLVTSYYVTPFTDLSLGLLAPKVNLNYDFIFKHLTISATWFIKTAQNRDRPDDLLGYVK